MRLLLGWSLRKARWRGVRFGEAVRDLIGVAGLMALIVVVCEAPSVRRLLPLGHVTLVMVLAAVAAGTLAAVLAHILARVTGDRRCTWLSVTFALYTVVAAPAATIGATFDRAESAIGMARMFAGLLVAALFLVIAWGPSPPRGWNGWRLAGAGFVLTLGAAVLASGFPAVTLLLIRSLSLWVGLTLLGIVFALAITAVGWAKGSPPLGRVGLGCAVIALSHAYQLDLAGEPLPALGLGFSVMRLFGVALVLISLVQLMRAALGTANSEAAEREEELRLAKRDLRHAAERDHELRNGIAGLAAAAHVFRAHDFRAPDASGEPEVGVLGSAVAAELVRLDALLRGPNDACPAEPSSEGRPSARYALLPLLSEQVALRRSAGMDIRLDVEPGLWVYGSSTGLAQVITNVLANCAEHAAGSPVRVQATLWARTIRVRVSDFGPGFAPRDPRPGSGRGLGLGISRQLLRADGGRLLIRPNGGGRRPGCTVVVELPAAPVGAAGQVAAPAVWRSDTLGSPTMPLRVSSGGG